WLRRTPYFIACFAVVGGMFAFVVPVWVFRRPFVFGRVVKQGSRASPWGGAHYLGGRGRLKAGG
ncbi:hypothetical protein, partial [Neisseria bacilliformis]